MAKRLRYFDSDVFYRIETDSFTTFYTALTSGDYLIIAIKSLILAGISPVAKVGRRFQKYSKSYLDYLNGKVKFFTRGGKVIAIKPSFKVTAAKGKRGEYSPLSFSKIASGRSAKSAKVEVLNRGGVRGKFDKPFPNKKNSPVNLYATGEMMDSLNIKRISNVAYVGFTDKKAVYHDKLGAGKSKVIRRLLPTRQGEKFVSNIDRDVKALAKASITKTLEKNRLGLKISFVLSTKR